METKFKYKLNNFSYIIMFDLASKKTGVCLWDIKQNKPIETRPLVVDNKEELPAYCLEQLISGYVDDIIQRYSLDKRAFLFCKEAMPTQLHGGMSTVQTFVALARSHAVLDTYLRRNDFDVYDYTGVYPITTHSYLKKLNGWEIGHTVEKQDIQKYVEQTYNLSGLTMDEYDAVFLAKTFIEVKWNKDLDEALKEERRHQKSLKAPSAIKTSSERQEFLKGLKI